MRRLNLMQLGRNVEPMLDCKRTLGPCSLKPPGQPPPPPPPRPKPFQWIYLWAMISLFGTFGMYASNESQTAGRMQALVKMLNQPEVVPIYKKTFKSMYKLYLWRKANAVKSDKYIWRPRRKKRTPYSDEDLPDCVQYLIIGAGAAGWAAYRAIKLHDKTAKVFFITMEDSIPYQRPPLSKSMWFNPEPPDLTSLSYIDNEKRKTMYNAECTEFMDPVKFDQKKRGPAVSIATGWCVMRVDADDHVAYVKTMSGERPIYYERCLLAPGSKPKNLAIFKSAPKKIRQKICLLHTIRDFEIAYRKVKEAKHVTIIGGGPLACELAWHLGRMNKVVERPDGVPPLDVVQVYKDKGVLSGILPEYLGEWAAEQIKCEGVTVVPKAQVYDVFESEDGRLEMTLSNGKSIVTDYAFVAVGAEPQTNMAENSLLERDEVNGGYLVNTELEARTHLYIAGDAASYYSQWRDTRLRSDHYINAEEQGFVAGANMTGYWTPCNMEPNYWVKLGEYLEMEVVGEVGACLPIVGLFKECNDEASVKEAEVITSDGKKNCFKNRSAEYFNKYKRGLLFYLRDDIVVGFVFWNLPPVEDRKEVVTELLRAKPTYEDLNTLAELLGFPSTRCAKKAAAEVAQEACPTITNWKVF